MDKEIVITILPDESDFSAELWINNIIVAEFFRKKGFIEISLVRSEFNLEFSLDEFIELLIDVKKRLSLYLSDTQNL